MNSQIQTQLITIIFVIFFAFTLSPISLVLHISAIFNIHLFMYSSSSLKSSTSLPCTYMDKSSVFLKKLVSKTNKKTIAPIPSPSSSTSTTSTAKHIPITIPAKLTQAQREAALPFLTQEPPKPKKSVSSASEKAKSLGRFFKKLAKSLPTKECIKSTPEEKKNKTQYKLTFTPIIKKKETATESKVEVTEIVWYDSKVSSISTASEIEQEVTPESDSSSATQVAQRIWDRDQTVCDNLEHIVAWIGNGQASSSSILQAYMSHFDFKNLKLEQAFRNLCSKLYLKGETQQIDRILLGFSTRYFSCNPYCIFGSTDVVHAIVYSLLLLNTDLHVAQGEYKKMSQSEFVKNTMSAVISTRSPSSVRSFEWTPLQRTSSHKSTTSTRCSTKSNASCMTESWQIEIKDLLKQMYTNIRQSQITNSTSSPAASTQQQKRMSGTFKLTWKGARDAAPILDSSSSIVSVQSSTANSIMQYQAVASHLQNTELPTSYISNAPYYKEGMVARKYILESKDQKAKHRDWKDCFMVIERSQLRMYKLDTTSYKRSRSYTFSDTASQCSTSSSAVGGGDWMSNAQLIGTIDLKHTLSNALPSGYSRQREHAFTLEQSNGAISVFHVGSAEQVHEWVSTCNYWAARESKEPLVGGISSMEYGWGLCLDSLKDAMVHEWQAPGCPTISTMLEESAQLDMLRKHVQELVSQLDSHRDIKPKMESHFMSARFGVRAMNNWENKSHYLLHEIIKYQNYCNSIENSLHLQAAFTVH